MVALGFVIVFILKSFEIGFASIKHCHPGTGRCYWMGTGSLNFGDARAACQSEGGDLAITETEELLAFVHSKSLVDVRLGLSDAEVEGDWRWVNGAAISYNGFNVNEPNGGTGSNCAWLYPAGNWDDRLCSGGLTFLCSSTEMYMNKEKVNSTVLTDDDDTTCVQLDGSEGCDKDQISVKYIFVNQRVAVNITISNSSCGDLLVTCKVGMSSGWYGNFKRCGMTSVETITTSKHKCHFQCDVTDMATNEIKLSSKIAATNQIQICEIRYD